MEFLSTEFWSDIDLYANIIIIIIIDFFFYTGIYDEDPEIITLSRADFCKN